MGYPLLYTTRKRWITVLRHAIENTEDKTLLDFGKSKFAAQHGKVGYNTVEYTTAFLLSDWLYFLWHGINYCKHDNCILKLSPPGVHFAMGARNTVSDFLYMFECFSKYYLLHTRATLVSSIATALPQMRQIPSIGAINVSRMSGQTRGLNVKVINMNFISN